MHSFKYFLILQHFDFIIFSYGALHAKNYLNTIQHTMAI